MIEVKNGLLTNNLGIDESEDYFGPLYRFVRDDDITDVDFNGTDLWLTNSKNERYHSDAKFSDEFIEQFTKRVANAVSKPFHKQQPILEAETERLRITIVHESVAISGRSICIRKSLPYVRMTEAGMLRDKYCSKEILNLLKSCIISKQNIVFCGEPGAGKTECAKFFSQYIPANERVITIEDNPEWHYKDINPQKDCVELKVGPQMDYTTAIKTCLRLNPKWMMLSESRSTEILKLLEGFSTGVKGITTLHANDVRTVPDRMVNMGGQARNESRMENDIYSFIDLAVLIRRKEVMEENGESHIRRYIDQLCYFERENGANLCHMIVEDGRVLTTTLPKGLLRKFEYAGLPDPMQPDSDSDFSSFEIPQTDAFSSDIAASDACTTDAFPSEPTREEPDIPFPASDQTVALYQKMRSEEQGGFVSFLPPRTKGTYRGLAHGFA